MDGEEHGYYLVATTTGGIAVGLVESACAQTGATVGTNEAVGMVCPS